MANPRIYVGALAPEGITVTIEAPTGGSSILSTVSSVALLAHRDGAGGSPVSWPAQIVQRTPKLVVEHQFLSGEVSVAGDYVVVPTLTVSTGTIRAEAFTLEVIDPYA